MWRGRMRGGRRATGSEIDKKVALGGRGKGLAAVQVKESAEWG